MNISRGKAQCDAISILTSISYKIRIRKVSYIDRVFSDLGFTYCTIFLYSVTLLILQGTVAIETCQAK